MLFCGCSKSDKAFVDDKYRNFYEIFPGVFYDSDGDGRGDINGITYKLDYLEDLSVTGIWLTPIMPSPSYHKYDVVNYYDVDPELGTLDDFRNLVSKAHAKNIHVIIDMVINHTSTENEWFATARNYLESLPISDERSLDELSKECPYLDYYIFSDSNNGDGWYEVTGTKYYYYSAFSYTMPDLNHKNESVNAAIKDIASFWVGDVGVDGFRMDAVKHLENGDTSFNCECLNDLYTYCQTINPDFYMVSEVWDSEGTIASYYLSGTDSFFNFDLGNSEGKIIKAAQGSFKASKLVTYMKQYEEDFGAQNPDYIDAPFITNHDMGRVSNALQSDISALKFAGGLLSTMDGNTFIYYGEEIGMKSKGTKDENKRLPMLWDYSAADASFNDADGICQAFANSDKDINSKFDGVAGQLKDDNSILLYYQKAFKLRLNNPELARGKIFIDEQYTDGDIAIITKTWENSSITIIYNSSKDTAIPLSLKDSSYAKLKIVGFLTVDNEEIKYKNGELIMPPRSIVYLK